MAFSLGNSLGRMAHRVLGRPIAHAGALRPRSVCDTGAVAEENQAEVRAITDAGAFIMGRNMFGPDRGEWTSTGRVGGVTSRPITPRCSSSPIVSGKNSPWRAGPPSTSSPMASTPHWNGPGPPPTSATSPSPGGAGTVNQYLAAGLVDELRVHVTPSIIGGGSRLFDGVPPMAFEQVSARGATGVTHIVYRPVR